MTESYDVTPEQARASLAVWTETKCNRCRGDVSKDGGRWVHEFPDADCYGPAEDDITEQQRVHSVIWGRIAIGADNDLESALAHIADSQRLRLKLPSRRGDHNLAVLLPDGKWWVYGTRALSALEELDVAEAVG